MSQEVDKKTIKRNIEIFGGILLGLGIILLMVSLGFNIIFFPFLFLLLLLLLFAGSEGGSGGGGETIILPMYFGTDSSYSGGNQNKYLIGFGSLLTIFGIGLIGYANTQINVNSLEIKDNNQL